MGRRRGRMRRRVVGGAFDLVADRAPWLTDQAYRVVAAPLQWVDPGGAAQAAHGRLDTIRDRIAAMAATGRVPRAEQRRIARDLARTRDDLGRIVSRLPPVQATALTLRLDAYVEAFDALTGPAGTAVARRGRRRSLAERGRDAAVLSGAAATAWAGLLVGGAGTIAVEGALAAGAAGAAGATAVRSRRRRRERITELANALAAADTHVPAAGGVTVPQLDRARADLLRRAAAARRLDARGAALLRSIGGHLDDLLVRLLRDDLDTDVAFLVEATVTRYLPDTLEPFLALEDPRAVVRGRPAAVEVADQLAAIDRALDQARARPGRHHLETQLHLQGEFLRTKFGEGQAPAGRSGEAPPA